ncbi:MAG: MFS transporter [Bacteroidales bacterium]
MKSKSGKWYPWAVVALLWGVALLNYMDRQMLSTMKSAIMADIIELDKAENFGRLMAVFLWVYGLMSPAAGLIADRVNRKLLIAGSLGVWSFVTLAMGFAKDYQQLYLLRAIMGISEALYIPAALSLIADWHTGSTRSLAVGIHMTGLYTGQALGGFGATVAASWSWQSAFMSFGFVGIIYSCILLIFLRERRTFQAPGKKVNHPSAESSRYHVLYSLRLLLSRPVFWIILLYFAVPSLPGWAVKNWLPTLFAESLGIEMTKAGPLSTITIAVSSLAGVISGGLLADRWITSNLRGRMYTSAAGLLFTIPALLLLGFGSSLFLILAGAILFGLGFGMFDANNMPVLCQFVSPGYRATGYGLMNMTGVFAGALITNFLGKSTDSGSLGHDIAILSFPVLVAVLLFLIFLKPSGTDKVEN